jgi:serine/threonine protein kinase
MEQPNTRLLELKEQIEHAIRGHVQQMFVPQGTTEDDVYQCVRDIMRENPDIFWFSHQWKYTENDLTIRFQYTIGKERSITAKKQIEDVIQNDFRINNVFPLSIPEQIMYVYKWIALYCKYNIYSAYNQTIYSVFVCRNSVCTGYAKAAQYLFKVLGIESKLVFGTMHNAEKGSRHCWLLVKVNNQWYHHDPTFAAPEISDLLVKAGVTPIYGAEGLVYNYFCCDTESIKHSRIIEDESDLPICTSKIDFKSWQNISIHLHRTEGTEQQGVKGCLVSKTGKFSDVYLWHSEKNVQSVVKIYRDDPSHAFRVHESLMMRQLNPSNHVLHVLGETDNQDGLIIEQATPLADLLCSHYYQLSAVNFCKLLLDVLAGLQDCMKFGVYYRDIHLNNIYRTPKGHYVLGDFGSCVWIDNDKTSNPSGVGSPWYLAPETYLNGDFYEESATYGIGLLAYFLLNDLFPPLWNEYGKSSLDHRMQGEELPLPALLKKPSCAFEQLMASVIKKSLSFDLSDRYLVLSDLEKAIKKCVLLVNDEDYLLIDGGSSERIFKLDSEETIDGKDYNRHTDFHSTCKIFPDIIVSNGKNEQEAEKKHRPKGSVYDVNTSGEECSPCPPHDHTHTYGRINDFATTACGPTVFDNGIHTTYQPQCVHEHLSEKTSKRSIWSKLFGERKKAITEDEVYSSVFAPSEVKPKSHLVAQVYLHLLEETEQVSRLAVESDKNAERRDYIPLQCKLKKGDKVDVSLNIYGETLLMSDKKSVVWQGAFTKCSFDYFVPKDFDVDELSCVALLTVNDIPVGEMRFITKIVEQPKQLNSEIIAHKYNKVFISYAHKDEAKVKSFHEGLKLAGIDHFFDRAYLKTGDVFPQVIQDYINSADLFVLFWSENASKSEYVQKERRQALERAFPQVKPHQAAKLSIYPMSIEPRAELPNDMRDYYHFGEI